MLGNNRDVNPGYKEKLQSMKGGSNVTASFTSGLRQNSFKDSVNGKLGLHADKNYAEPHSGVPQRLKTGGMADGGDTMLNRGQKDNEKVFKRGGSFGNERAAGVPQSSHQFEKMPRHGDSNQTQFAKKPHHGDAGQRQFEKKTARAKVGGQMEPEHHSWGSFVKGLKNVGQGLVHAGTLGAVDIGGHGFLHDAGDTIGNVRRKVASAVVPVLSGGAMSGDNALNKGGKVQKKAIGGVAKIRHGQMKKEDMA